MEILPIEFGKSVLPESMIFVNGDANTPREIIFRNEIHGFIVSRQIINN